MSIPLPDSTTTFEFVNRVQALAGLDSYEQAERVTSATLQVLGESVSRGEAKRLARWLPPELAGELAARDGVAKGFGARGVDAKGLDTKGLDTKRFDAKGLEPLPTFDRDQFLGKVAARLHTTGMEWVEEQASAALQVLRSAAPANRINDVLAELPPDLCAMFG